MTKKMTTTMTMDMERVMTMKMIANHSDLAREEAETVAVQETADHRLKVSSLANYQTG